MPAENVIERLREMVESPCTLQYLMANKADVEKLIRVAEAAERLVAYEVDGERLHTPHQAGADLIAAVRAGGSDV